MASQGWELCLIFKAGLRASVPLGALNRAVGAFSAPPRLHRHKASRHLALRHSLPQSNRLLRLPDPASSSVPRSPGGHGDSLRPAPGRGNTPPSDPRTWCHARLTREADCLSGECGSRGLPHPPLASSSATRSPEPLQFLFLRSGSPPPRSSEGDGELGRLPSPLKELAVDLLPLPIPASAVALKLVLIFLKSSLTVASSPFSTSVRSAWWTSRPKPATSWRELISVQQTGWCLLGSTRWHSSSSDPEGSFIECPRLSEEAADRLKRAPSEDVDVSKSSS